MEINIKNDSTVEIVGNIKSLEHYNMIKQTMQQLVSKGSKHITVNVVDSLSMVSSVIGYFIKLKNLEGVDLHVNVSDERLYNLLDQLSLLSVFKVKLLT